MTIYNKPVELIIDVPTATAKSAGGKAIDKVLAEAGIPVNELETRSARLKLGKQAPMAKGAKSAAPVAEKLYLKTGISDAEANPWDVAHTAVKQMGASVGFVEPDMMHEYAMDRNAGKSYKKGNTNAKSVTDDTGFDPDWLPHKNVIWHLDDAYSGLKSARDAVQDINYLIRIGHIDTGYSDKHPVIRKEIKENKLQRSFVDGEDIKNACDRLTDGMMRMPGHGTGTLGVLSGGRIKLKTDSGMFDDFLGAAPFAEIVSCRIAKSVVLFKTSAFADALHYLTMLGRSGKPVHVVSMSMGGAPARSWVEAVNAAYMSGITVVTAAGNNFNKLPTQHVIYPARFGRVIAACGATYDNMPYTSSKLGEMGGCFGPDKWMSKALAAYTPNVPWASAADGNINFAGAGTSCATPQIAAAAAIYYRRWHTELDAMLPWQRVEAIRNALYKSAKKSMGNGGDYRQCFGNGILRAAAALKIPPGAAGLKMTEEDTMPWFPILSTLFKAKPGKQMEMYQTELAQLVYQYKELREVIDDDSKDYSKLSAKKWKQFKDAVMAHPAASMALKKAILSSI
jgi:subtilisin family serine protease